MTTALQDQLRRIAVAAGVSTSKGVRGKPSLLYTFQEAADIGIQDTYTVSLQGLDQLCRFDPRFQAYRKTLFSPANQAFERDQQSAEVVSRLNAAIESFCALLASCFLLPAAFKALEFLIRRYHVHEHNIDALMRMALPYHATPEFVRLVHVLRLDDTMFEFLKPMQKSGAMMPRESIVKRCLADKSLLRFVLESGKELGSARTAARAVMPFYAAVMCEVLSDVGNVDEVFLSLLLPYLLHGLGPDAIPDLKGATYMIIVQLCSRATMSSELASALTTEVSKSATPAMVHQALLVLSHLSTTQPHLRSLQDSAFRALARLPGFATEIDKLARMGHRTEKFLLLVGQAAVDAAFESDAYESIAEEIIGVVPKAGDTALLLAERLLRNAAHRQGQDEQPVDVAVHLLQAFEGCHSEAMEKAVNEILASLDRSGDDSKAKEMLTSTLQKAFAGTLRAPFPDAGTTLAVAIDAASAGIRRLALERLDEMVRDENQAADEVLRGALLRRLADDDPTVVLTALNTSSLLNLPPSAIMHGCAECLYNALRAAQMKDARKRERAASRKVARKAVKVLMMSFLEKYPEHVEDVVEILLPASLSTMHARKVAEDVLKCAAAAFDRHVVLAALKEAREAMPVGGQDAVEVPNGRSSDDAGKSSRKSTSKKQKNKKSDASKEEMVTLSRARGDDDGRHNREVIDALAKVAAKDEIARDVLIRFQNSVYSRTRVMSLAVSNVAMHMSGGEPLAFATVARFGNQDGTGSVWEARGVEEQNVAYEYSININPKSGMMDDMSVMGMASGKLQPYQLEPAVLLTALQVIPVDNLKDLGNAGLRTIFRNLAIKPASLWRHHLQEFLIKLQSIRSAAKFLEDIWCHPMEVLEEEKSDQVLERCVALQLWAECFAHGLDASSVPEEKQRSSKRSHPRRSKSLTASDEHKTDENTSSHPTALIPNIFYVMSSTSRDIRMSASLACRTLAKTMETWWTLMDDQASVNTSGSFLEKITMTSLLNALEDSAEAIQNDSEAVELLLRSSFLQTTASGPESALSLRIVRADADKLKEFLIQQIPHSTSNAKLACVPLLVRVLDVDGESTALLEAANVLLKKFALSQEDPLRLKIDGSDTHAIEALDAISGLLASESLLLAVFSSKDASLQQSTLESILGFLSIPAPTAVAPSRLSVLNGITCSVFEAMDTDAKRKIFVALTTLSSHDDDAKCRAAATSHVDQFHLEAETLVPLLSLEYIKDSDSIRLSTSRRKRRGTGKLGSEKRDSVSASASESTEDAVSSLSADALATCAAVLEVLQWKENIKDALNLVPHINGLVEVLSTVLKAPQTSTVGAKHESSGRIVASAAYLEELCLSYLTSLAKRHMKSSVGGPVESRTRIEAHIELAPSPRSRINKKASKTLVAVDGDDVLSPFDIDLTIKCAQEASTGTLRVQALHLIQTLAAAAPHQALSRVLDVISILGSSAPSFSSRNVIDSYSRNIASECLSSVAKAWISAGQTTDDIVDYTVKVVATAPALYRRLLLISLIGALPGISGLCSAILCLLSRLLEMNVELERPSLEDDGELWPMDIAITVFNQQSNPAHRMKALAFAMRDAKDHWARSGEMKLSVMVTAFSSKMLRSGFSSEREHSISGRTEDSGFEDACMELLEICLLQLHMAGTLQRSEEKERDTFNKRSFDSLSSETVDIINSLRGLMNPVNLVHKLEILLRSTDIVDGVRRRALMLLASCVEDVRTGKGGVDMLDNNAKEMFLVPVQAIISILQRSPGVEDSTGMERSPVSNLTLQVALGTMSTLTTVFSTVEPTYFVQSVSHILPFLSAQTHPTVRGSALASLSSMIASLNRHIMPVLPATTKAILEAVSNAIRMLESSEIVEDEEDVASKESLELELEAALSALAVLVAHLGAFLSPYLRDILRVILSPLLLGDNQACEVCQKLAAQIRGRIPEVIPPRLLLPALAENSAETAADTKAEVMVGLLEILRSLTVSMDPRDVVVHNNEVFILILQSLDFGRRKLVAMAKDCKTLDEESFEEMRSVEKAAVASLVELTLKLSESKFRPLFFRLLEWATSAPPADAALLEETDSTLKSIVESTLPRRIALLSAVNELSERLRSVFAPYYQPLMDVVLLTLGDTSGAAPIKKKRRTKVVAASNESTMDEPLIATARVLAVRALHRLFAYDTSGFLDDAMFDRILPALVSQLQVVLAEDILPFLPSDPRLVVGLTPEARQNLDVAAQATVACLAAMALASGVTDVRWRPLNHAVLMVTRNEMPRARLSALEAILAIVDSLQEEYLSLLPESLPFLAELLEDDDYVVEARAAAALKRLEELSGEDLKDYLKI